MNEQLRHSKILSYLKEVGHISIQELVDQFGISPATARRDINKLYDLGRIHKVRRGAVHLDSSTQPVQPALCAPLMSAPADAVQNKDEKERIANVAASLCHDGDSVIINCGTTAFMMGSRLAGRDIQVITNYIPLANHLITEKHDKVIILGGQYYAGSASTMTPFEGDAQLYSANYIFTSGAGLTELGLTKIDPMTVMAEQKMMKQADKVVALVDSSKLGIRSGLLFCQAANIHILITGREANPEILQNLKEKGIQILLA